MNDNITIILASISMAMSLYRLITGFYQSVIKGSYESDDSEDEI